MKQPQMCPHFIAPPCPECLKDFEPIFVEERPSVLDDFVDIVDIFRD